MRISTLFDDPTARSAIEAAELDALNRINSLTPAQRAILPLICDGMQNKVAAHAIGISPRTLENHRAMIMAKTGCKTLAELVRLSIIGGQ